MYMSALTSKDNNKHCIGTATSSSIKGPYTPQNKPLACPLKQGGAIDPAGFQDEDGTRYVVYKIDGKKSNSPTPIMLQRVASDGITPQGKPTKLLEKDERDGPLIGRQVWSNRVIRITSRSRRICSAPRSTM